MECMYHLLRKKGFIVSIVTSTEAINFNTFPIGYLEGIAVRKTWEEAGIQNEPLNKLEIAIHFIFNNLLYICYPSYKEFYYDMQVEAFASAGKEIPLYVSSCLREGVLFLSRFIASPTNIGSVFPSSNSLIHAMTRKVLEGVTEESLPRYYLDIGAGTGSFSEGIIAKMRAQDHIDIVEYDEALCKLLQRRFRHLSNVHVHNVSIFDFTPPYRYDVIVTGLPLNNFSPDTVDQAFKKYIDLTCEGGSFCYFEYMLFPTLSQLARRLFFLTDAAQNFKQITAIKNKVQRQFPTEIDSVYANISPARAIHCKKHLEDIS